MMDIQEVPFMTIFDMPVNEVRMAPFNPVGRTEKRNVRVLLKAIQKAGRVIEPVKLSRDGVLGDGHRRVTCARMLGLETVPAIRYDLSAGELFALNGYALPPNIQQWGEAHALGLDILPSSKAGKIVEFEQAVGADDYRKIVVEMRKSPTIHSTAKRIMRYCSNDEPAFYNRAVWWMINQEMQVDAKTAMHDGISPDALEDAIENGYKLVKQWWHSISREAK